MASTLPRLTLLACSLALIGSPAYANPFDPYVPLLPVLGDGQWQDGTHVFELDAPADGSELLLLGLAGSSGNRGQLSLTVVGDTEDASVIGVYTPANGASFVNQGSLQITARSGGLAAAYGAMLAGGSGLTNHGTLRVHASGQEAYAHGAILENATFDNNGLIEVVADGDQSAMTAAAHSAQDMRNSGQIIARAQGGTAVADGLVAFGGVDRLIDNSGGLDIRATATTTAGTSMAIGMDLSATPVATASTLTNRGQLNVSASGGRSARAAGMLAADPEDWNNSILQDGRLANLGRLTVAAQATSGTADAWALAASGHDNEISNDGSIAARAQGGHLGGTSGLGNARASALAAMGDNNTLGNRGQIDAMAQGGSLDGHNMASAYGMETRGNGNTLSNEGLIRVSAQGGKQTPSSPASAYAYSYAYGLYADGDGSRITNLGTLEVSASGGSKLDGDSNSAKGNAYGIMVKGTNSTIEQHGFLMVNAQAQAGRDANAYGIYIEGGGTHTLNASGRIEVAASGGNNTAHEVLLSGGQLDITRYHLGVGAPAADEQLRAFRVEDGGTLNFAATKLILSPGAGFGGQQQFKLVDHISADGSATASGSIASVESAHRMLAASIAGNSWDTAEMTLSLAEGARGTRTDALAASYATDSTRALMRPLNAAIAAGNSSFVTPLYRHVRGDEDGGWRANTSGALFGFNRALGKGSWGVDFSVENDRFQRSDAYMQGSRNTADRFGVGVHALRTLPNDTTLRAGARYQYADIDVQRHDRELAARANADTSAHSVWLYGMLSRPLGSTLTLEGSLDQLWHRQDGYRLGWDNPAAQWADSEIEKVRAASLDAGARLVWQDAAHAWQPRAALGARARLHGDSLELNQRFAGFSYAQQADTQRLRGTLELGLARPLAKGALTLDYALEADSERTSQALTLGWRQLF
ncbi:autotransporter outer membrane beta-barrel domain-containing protein [Crenobacter caeni]|uniref:Autotransporter outer membrane beta-barrel domain-containing protein n=1 Tax=Crenobacter caeni TaxID=2705474 RepID=A0A6B2KU04_9NEIS|nr:autotransporter outer membrane beta-barrel domain-containing protein [Crenobacter caeni]NDV13726.1 autotransporter outer membrane beta-barrel domain-containing protein [Crenobacter caeni]